MRVRALRASPRCFRRTWARVAGRFVSRRLHVRKRTRQCLAAAVRGVAGFGVVMIAPSLARGATVTWSGAGADDNWSNPANWGGTAVSANDAIFGNTDVAPAA